MKRNALILVFLLLSNFLIGQSGFGPILIPSDPCCPFSTPHILDGVGWQYDGEKCALDIGVDIDGFEMFFWENKLYVKQNCDIVDYNDCCPRGFEFDGRNCRYNGRLPFIIDNNDKWLYEDIYSLGSSIFLETECCQCPNNKIKWYENVALPIGLSNERLLPSSYYNGQDCKTLIKVDPQLEYFVKDDYFCVKKDCGLYPSQNGNNCCPAGFTYNGDNDCRSNLRIGNADWFVFGGEVYFEPNCCANPGQDTKNDICDWLASLSETDENRDFQMADIDDMLTITFDTKCVRDRLIITVDGEIKVDSGNFSSMLCRSFSTPCNDPFYELNLKCPEQTYGCGTDFERSFEWKACANINIQIIVDVCNDNPNDSFYEINCY